MERNKVVDFFGLTDLSSKNEMNNMINELERTSRPVKKGSLGVIMHVLLNGLSKLDQKLALRTKK